VNNTINNTIAGNLTGTSISTVQGTIIGIVAIIMIACFIIIFIIIRKRSKKESEEVPEELPKLSNYEGEPKMEDCADIEKEELNRMLEKEKVSEPEPIRQAKAGATLLSTEKCYSVGEFRFKEALRIPKGEKVKKIVVFDGEFQIFTEQVN